MQPIHQILDLADFVAATGYAVQIEIAAHTYQIAVRRRLVRKCRHRTGIFPIGRGLLQYIKVVPHFTHLFHKGLKLRISAQGIPLLVALYPVILGKSQLYCDVQMRQSLLVSSLRCPSAGRTIKPRGGGLLHVSHHLSAVRPNPVYNRREPTHEVGQAASLQTLFIR